MLKKLRPLAVAAGLFVCCAPAFAQRPAAPANRQNAERAASIKEQARKMARAFIDEDLETLLDATHPKIFELAGGRAPLLATLKAGFAEGRARGARVVSYEPGEPGAIKRAGAKLLSVVPVEMKVDFPERTFTQKSFLLAVSTDGGKVWKFIDGTQLNQDTLRVLVPGAARVVTLPKPEEPVVERKP
jgi:hypothetical protein